MTFNLREVSVPVAGTTDSILFSDHVFDVDATNEDIYFRVAKQLISNVMDGFNATIFAYGQTSSGKTHTILGNEVEPGILEKAVNDIFSIINQKAQKQFLLR